MSEIREEYKKGAPHYDASINPNIYHEEVADSVLPSLSVDVFESNSLDLQVIPKKHNVPSPMSVASSSSSNRELVIHYVETATNNIVYPRLVFNLNRISSVRDMLNLPILLYIINHIDTEKYSIEEMETLTSECSGGIRMGVSCYPQYHGDNSAYRNVALQTAVKSSM